MVSNIRIVASVFLLFLMGLPKTTFKSNVILLANVTSKKRNLNTCVGFQTKVYYINLNVDGTSIDLNPSLYQVPRGIKYIEVQNSSLVLHSRSYQLWCVLYIVIDLIQTI